MSLGLTKTKRRISSVQSTKKITKAMEMVSTVKLKRYRDFFDGDSLYLEKLTDLLGILFKLDGEEGSHYGKEVEEASGSLYIVISSDLGLCASYNNNVLAYADKTIDKEKDTVLPIGTKAISHFQREGYKNIHDPLPGLDLAMDSRLIDLSALSLKQEFNEGKYKKIVILYTRYVNSLNFVPSSWILLPVKIDRELKESEIYCPPLFDENARRVIHQLLPQYLGAEIRGKLIESQLSEQASRRNAMEQANDNADELLDKLTIEYNKARQSAITQEITEVIAGAKGA